MAAAAPLSFRIAQLEPSVAANAFAFHSAITASDPHIWTRNEEQIRRLADDGCLFGAWLEQSGDLVGLVYALREGDTWEIGGLSVSDEFKGRGLGSAPVRFALGFTMAFESPWKPTRRPKLQVIAHIHKENDDPRRIFQRLQFKHVREVFAGEEAPVSMKRDKSGRVPGDELAFTKEGLVDLSRWFNDEFQGTLKSGDNIHFDLWDASLDDLREMLRAIEGQSPD